MEILFIAVVIGCIPAAIASNKGHSFVAWWIFGAALFILALPLALMLKPVSQSASPSTPDAPTRSDVVFVEQGSRYIFGYTLAAPPAYCVWDRQTPGPPIFKVPYGEHGKSEAHDRYQGLEAPALQGSI